MSGVKISALPAVASALSTDIFPVVQAGVTSQETLAQVQTLFGFSSGILAMANGGTGAALVADNGAVVYSTGSALALLAHVTTAGKMLQSGNAAPPTWSTPTYPSASGTAGKILRSDGTNNVYSTSTFADTYAINTILYNASANTVSGLATANSATLITSAGGVPSLSQTLPSAVQTNITALGTQAQALNMGTHLINAVVDPVSAQDAATKNYVDTVAQGRVFKDPCSAASTTTLTVTYANGSSGVGATLTNAGAQAAFQIDGYSASVNDRILIKDQSSTLQNGIYVVTTVGSGATNWVLTRATDMDTASEFKGGTTFIIGGTVNAGRTYTETATVVTVGTDAVTFSLTGDASGSTTIVTQVFTGNGTYTPTTGMVSCIVEIVGGGAGGGGCANGAAAAAAGGGGGGGGYCRKTYTAALIGANAAVVIGAAANGGSAGNNDGTNGNNSTFTPAGAGAILTASGGVKGGGGPSGNPALSYDGSGGAGGTGTNGDINISGQTGSYGTIAAGTYAAAGYGGASQFGPTTTPLPGSAGSNGAGYGTGGSGASMADNTARAGGNGAAGVCYITELVTV